MALQTTIGRDSIPEGFVVTTKQEALEYQKALLNKFFLRYGKYVAAAAVAVSSLTITRHFARYMKITYFPHYMMYPTVAALPTYLTCFKFDREVTHNVLLMKITCPMCMQLKYLLRQSAYSIFYPTFSAVCLSSLIALQNSAVNFPLYGSQPKEFFKYTLKIIQAGSMRYQLLGAFNIFTAFMLPYLQNLELQNINNILSEKQHKSALRQHIS
ncbi:hypothetical protein RUM43_002136 [Polyplax serrata]|uniref:Uncharacterized protein n=1 Tax=Polyplax serrata TaxID=468196 RepID=A0AAN8NYE4_POLSC